jgi:hypothetical protein
LSTPLGHSLYVLKGPATGARSGAFRKAPDHLPKAGSGNLQGHNCGCLSSWHGCSRMQSRELCHDSCSRCCKRSPLESSRCSADVALLQVAVHSLRDAPLCSASSVHRRLLVIGHHPLSVFINVAVDCAASAPGARLCFVVVAKAAVAAPAVQPSQRAPRLLL